MSPTWQEIASTKRETLNSLIPTKWTLPSETLSSLKHVKNVTGIPAQLLTEREVEITEYDAQDLVEKISKGELTALEVTVAFCHRAAIAHQLVNCLSEITFEAALSQAEYLDAHFLSTGKTIGPLHCLPISLKDAFRVQGTETSLGYVAWLGNKETVESESLLVKKLRELGAVVYVKTNVPTSLMAIETNNNIVGYTTNPYNRDLSSGGSSGGEAALIALRGSPLGLGTDVGASIRLPASFCGLFGLKPSHGRLPYLGIANSMEGHNTVPSVIGPLSHSLPSLSFLMSAILSTSPWTTDPSVLNLPWDTKKSEDVKARAKKSGLTFGIMKCNGVVTPHPPVQRAMEIVVSALKAQGHEIIEWQPAAHSEAFHLLWSTFAADGGVDIHSVLSQSGEIPVPEVAVSYGEKLGTLSVSSINDLWALQTSIYDFQTQYLAYWNSTVEKTGNGSMVDAVIMPAAPTASYRKGEGLYFGYTGVWNVLDYSVVTVPVTKVEKERDGEGGEFKETGDLDRKVWETYDAETFDGLPVGVQVVCRRLEEEKVLAVAEEVVRCLN